MSDSDRSILYRASPSNDENCCCKYLKTILATLYVIAIHAVLAYFIWGYFNQTSELNIFRSKCPICPIISSTTNQSNSNITTKPCPIMTPTPTPNPVTIPIVPQSAPSPCPPPAPPCKFCPTATPCPAPSPPCPPKTPACPPLAPPCQVCPTAIPCPPPSPPCPPSP